MARLTRSTILCRDLMEENAEEIRTSALQKSRYTSVRIWPLAFHLWQAQSLKVAVLSIRRNHQNGDWFLMNQAIIVCSRGGRMAIHSKRVLNFRKRIGPIVVRND